jgi:hypothetical protein
MEWQALSMQTTRLRVEVFGFFFFGVVRKMASKGEISPTLRLWDRVYISISLFYIRFLSFYLGT